MPISGATPILVGVDFCTGRRRCAAPPSLALALTLLSAPAARAVTIQLLFDPMMLDSRSTGTFSATETAVLNQAAAEWQTALPGPGSLNVTFLKSNPSQVGSLSGKIGIATDFVGSGGTDPASGRQLGTPQSGTVLVNDTISFFVDPTPADDSEYGPVASAPPTYLATGSGPALGQHDLFSNAIHEIGHALGFTSNFQNFWMGVQSSPNPGDGGRPVYAFAAPPNIGSAATDYMANPMDPNLLVNGGVFLLSPSLEDETLTSQNVSSHTDDAGGAGLAAGFFPFDALNPGLATSERRHVSFADADILCDAFGYTCGTVIPEPSTYLLLAASLAGLIALRRRRT